VPDAQPADGSHRRGDADQLGQHVLVVETDPTHPEPLRGGGQPQVLDGEHGGEQAGVGHGVSAEHVRSAASLIVGDHDTEAALADPFDLDGVEGGCPLWRKGVRELGALVRHVLSEALQGGR